MSCNVVSCGGRGTLRHDNMFHNVSKIVLCDRHNAFARFSENELHISWQAQHFGMSCAFYVAGAALDVSCCVIFFRIALSGLPQVMTTCKFRGRHGIL